MAKARKLSVSSYLNKLAIEIARQNKLSAEPDKPTTATAVLKEALGLGLDKQLAQKGMRKAVMERLSGKKK